MKKYLVFPFYLVLGLMVVFATLTGCRPRSTVSVPVHSRTLHLGHLAAAGTTFDILAHRIKEYVETRSNGRYNILIYSGGTLGSHRMLVESMIAGTVDMAIVTSPDLSNYADDLGVLDLPFLFSDWDEVFRFLHSDIINEFYAITDEAGISTLAFMPRGFRHATNNRGPITRPSDFNNMNIRVVGNVTYIDTFTALGATPHAIPWEQTYAALQEGRVEAHENTIITINENHIYEVQNYLSKTGHFFAFAAVVASPITLNSIPASDQELIRKAVFDAALNLSTEQLAAENAALVDLQNNGMLINEIPDRQPFIDMMESVYENFFMSHSRKYYDLLRNAIR